MSIDISSHSNPRFKYLKSLEKSRNRKRDGVFLMEGRPELDHALKMGWRPRSIAWCEAYLAESDVRALFGEQDPTCEWLQLSKPLFDELCYQQVPGNCLAVFPNREVDFQDWPDDGSPIVVLENVEKPGNLGAILRTCDAAGIGRVLVCDSSIDLYNPNVIRNSRGAVFSVSCSFTDNASALRWLQGRGYRILAAALSDRSRDFHAVLKDHAAAPCALLFGPESTGLSDFWMEHASDHLIVPMRGQVDSLNLSVTVGIVAYAFAYDKAATDAKQ